MERKKKKTKHTVRLSGAKPQGFNSRFIEVPYCGPVT
uniref:Uncharacterized protein n=1 Tax=Anguilla anguilla TaxID=7936 RepID=A0A0E9VVK1_ANGAN